MTRRPLVALLTFVLLLATSCAMAREWVKDEVQKETAAYLSKNAPQSAAKADTDGDGKTSFEEWKAYLLGGTGLLAFAGEILRRKINGVKDDTNQALAVAHARIDRRQRRTDA